MDNMGKTRLSADDVYDWLLNKDQILSLKGQISFYLGGVDIIVKQRDVVGNIMQEWIEGWLIKNNIDFAVNENTQMPPDFYLNPDNKKVELLEIKAFNYNGTPGFDIASFDMFEREIKEKPFVLDTTYLIFGYDMSADGVVTIKKMWKQKVWQITRPMKTKGGTEWPINLQIKDGVVHKIRPAKWYVKQTKYEIFRSLVDFLSAIEEAIYQNKDTRSDGAGWKQTMRKNYKAFYGVDLEIPRWDDIKDSYTKKKQLLTMATKKQTNTFPKSTLFHYPILLLLSDGKEHSRKEMLALAIEKLSISASDQKVTTPKGNRNKVDSWLGYAIADLIGAEYIYHSGKGYAITNAGKEFFNHHKEGFIAKELKVSAAYRRYKRIGEFSANPQPTPTPAPTPTPKEEGVVYILTNDSFKANYIKIGFTTDLEERLRSLYNTSVPKPFKVYALLKTRKFKFAEKLMHETFRDYRTGSDREFFLLIPEVALEQLKVVAEGLDGVVITYDDKGNEKKIFDYSK